MKIVFLSLGSYVDTNQNRAIKAFEELGVSELNMLLHWFALPRYVGGVLSGGVIGSLLGGPLGGLVGAALGGYLDRSNQFNDFY